MSKKLFYVYHCTHPVEMDKKANLTISEVVWKRQTVHTIVSRYTKQEKVLVIVNEKKVDEKDYKRTRIKTGDIIYLFPVVGFWGGIFAWILEVAIPSIIIGLAIAYIGGALFRQDIKQPDEPARGENAQSFAWNPRTTHREGGVQPRFYGRNLHTGNIVARWTDVDESGDEKLYMIVCYGEGPVQGLVSGYTWINDQPIGNFEDVTVQTRNGTFNQAAMTGFEQNKLEYSPKHTVTNEDGAFTFTTPNDVFDDIEYTLEFPRGLWYYDTMGGQNAHSVGVKVEISERGLSAWTTLLQTTISANNMSPIYKAYTASEQGFVCTYGKQYDLKLTKTTADQDVARYGDEVALRTVREVVDIAFTRPGKVLLGITALATESLSGDLNIKSVWDGRIVNVYNGTSWSLEYSANRAFVGLDIATQPVISGDGDTIAYTIERYEGLNPSKVDLALMYEWAVWCAGQVPDGTGSLENRMDCNIIFDYQTSLWEAFYEICQVGRFNAYWLGYKLTGWFDGPVSGAIDLVTFDNMMRDSWGSGWSDKSELAGSIEVFYKDRLQGYERKPVLRSNESAGSYTRVVSVEGTGLTSRSGAIRMGNHILERNRLIRNVNRFRMYKDAIRYTLGDVVRLQHNTPDWGQSYRVVAKVDTDTVTLDRTILNVSAGDALYLRTYDAVGEDIDVATYTVGSVAGANVTITTTWSIDPVKDYIVAIGTTKLRRIIQLEPTAEGYYDVTVETYDTDLFDADDTQPDSLYPDYTWPEAEKILNKPITWPNILQQVKNMIPPQPDVEIPWLSNIDWTGDEVDTVFWAGHLDSASDGTLLFRYRGVTYEINPGETTDEYIYWDPDFTDRFLTTNIVTVALAAGNWLVCVNKSGVAYPANAMQLIHAGILLAGTIRAESYAELRQTYVYNGDDSLDNSKPLTVPFKIVSEMTSIVSALVSFRIMPYRAYSTGAASGGGSSPTSSAGGGQTSSSGGYGATTGAAGWPYGGTTADATGNTGSTNLGTHYHTMTTHAHTVSGYTDNEDGTGVHAHDLSSYNVATNSVDPGDTYTANLGYHYHDLNNHDHAFTLPDHTHTAPAHTHTVSNHTHTVTIAAHVHGIDYGIHEETNSPQIHFHIDNGGGFGAASASYTSDQLDIDISGSLTGTGWKNIRFDSALSGANGRLRLAVIVELKLDVTA